MPPFQLFNMSPTFSILYRMPIVVAYVISYLPFRHASYGFIVRCFQLLCLLLENIHMLRKYDRCALLRSTI